MSTDVFARTTPAYKDVLVEAIQKKWSEIVGMTGDGVNDAPALKQATLVLQWG